MDDGGHGEPSGVLAGAERRLDPGRVRARAELPGTEAERDATFALIDAAFGQRRKMLRQALSELLGGSAAASARLEAAGIDPTARGEQLAVADFLALARAAG